MARNRFFIVLEMILERFLQVFLAPRVANPILFQACFQAIFHYFGVEIWTPGFPTTKFAYGCRFWEALGTVFLVSAALETCLKINGFLVM